MGAAAVGAGDAERTGDLTWEGLTAPLLAARLDVPQVALFADVGSTMDVAHRLAAEGAPAGSIVLADRQHAGRGRAGRTWTSPAGQGIWLTRLERPSDSSAAELWSVRVGLRLARALDAYSDRSVGVKWPNDLYLDGRKLGGILIEARWHDRQLLWVAVGVGINVRPPVGIPSATGLRPGTTRLEVLAALTRGLEGATALGPSLTDDERDECVARDVARGRLCVEPAKGRVVGIGPAGELLIETLHGVRAYRSGSLVFEDE